MNVVQVTPRYPPRVGGVETHVAEISERFVERGHEVTVLTADAGSDVTNREEHNGVTVRRYRGVAPNGAFHIAPRIALAVRRIDADVVHAHNYHSFPLLFAALGTDAPLVATPHYHGGSSNDVRTRLLRLYRPFGGWALRQARHVVAVSEWERHLLRADFGIDTTVVPNGLEIDRFRGVTPPNRERPYLVCAGRLEEYKGVQHVVRALQHLDGYDLVVAGTGPYRRKLEQLAAQHGVEDRVEFVGYVSDDRLLQLYAGADVFVSLSEFEAYGMTIAEALVSGTPCVVRAVGGLTDWVENPGVVGIDTPTPNVVGTAIERARNRQPKTDSIIDWDVVVDRLEKIYRTA